MAVAFSCTCFASVSCVISAPFFSTVSVVMQPRFDDATKGGLHFDALRKPKRECECCFFLVHAKKVDSCARARGKGGSCARARGKGGGEGNAQYKHKNESAVPPGRPQTQKKKKMGGVDILMALKEKKRGVAAVSTAWGAGTWQAHFDLKKKGGGGRTSRMTKRRHSQLFVVALLKSRG